MSATVDMPELEEATTSRPKILPPYHVILLWDEDHSFPYVVKMIQEIFKYDQQKAILLCKQLNEHKRVILVTCAKELAELRQDQIHSYGPDRSVKGCAGCMTCEIEPAN